MSNAIQLPLGNTTYTVERPVVFDVIRQLMRATSIPDDTPIFYAGEDGGLIQVGSDNSTLQPGDNRWPHSPHIELKAEFEAVQDLLLSTQPMGPSGSAAFHDPELDVIIRPTYTNYKVTLEVKYATSDQNAARKWRDLVRTYFSMGRTSFLHEVTYRYCIPEEILVILKSIHALRESIAGYGESLEQWLKKHLTYRMATEVNMDVTQKEVVICENQGRVQAFFDFEGDPPKEGKDSATGLWEIDFSYSFTYSKPVAVAFKYPTIIHQQLLDEKYCEDVSQDSFQERYARWALDSGVLSKSEPVIADLIYKANQGLDIPSFDKFIPKSILPTTVRVCTVLATMSPDNKRNMFRLDQLGDYQIKQEILDFIAESEHPFMTQLYGSILQVSLYQDDRIKPQTILRVGSDLSVYSTLDLPLRKTYRVRLSLVSDLNFLPAAAIHRLRNHPVAAELLIRAINQSINVAGNISGINKNKMGVRELAGIGLQQNGNDWTHTYPNGENIRGEGGLIWGLVQTLFVRTERTEP